MPPGLKGAKMLMLVNRETGKGLGVTVFDSEEAMRRGDEALNSMSPGGSNAARRSSSTKCRCIPSTDGPSTPSIEITGSVEPKHRVLALAPQHEQAHGARSSWIPSTAHPTGTEAGQRRCWNGTSRRDYWFGARRRGHRRCAMPRDRDPGDELPVHWLAALDAVAEACAAQRTASAPTRLVARRLHGADVSHMARTLLRMLRRHGYVSSIRDEEEGAPLRWTLTVAGRQARSTALIRQF